MKKINFFMTLGLFVGLTANAQVVNLGFETGDQKYHGTDPEQSEFYADHVNLQEGDVWVENCTDAHSGEFAFQATNVNTFKGNTWDRGFKVRNVSIEPATSYRVSFFVKAAPTYEMADGTTGNTAIKAALSIGVENFEAPFLSQKGNQYYYNYTSGMTGDWRKISFVSYYSSLDVMNQYLDNYDDNYTVDEATGDTTWYGKGKTSFPETFFLTINMYNPGEYILDDIKVEKSTLAGCSFFADVVKVDFGYSTNIAALANLNDGTVELPATSATVKVGDKDIPVFAVEGKSDGYLYIFLEEELEDDATVTVNFTPAADCPILYNTDKRPSMDIESDVIVLGFENEVCDFDETIDMLPLAWAAPKMLSSDPENDSFELDPVTFNKVTVNYNKALDLTTTSITLSNNGVDKDIADFTLSEDQCSITINVGTLANGEYTLTIAGLTNTFGIETIGEQTVSFSVGADGDTGTSETVWAPDFSKVADGTFPVGWISNDNGNIHQYGYDVSEAGDTAVWNYNWGANKGGGGSRMFTGFSGGDFTTGLYWRCLTGGATGTLTFGEQVKDNYLPDGSIDPTMDPALGLVLDARKYQLSFLMAAWKYAGGGTDASAGFPVFNFTLEDLEGNVYARFDNVTAQPCVEGGKTLNGASTKSVADFTVQTPGYYMLKFTVNDVTELLLAEVKLITMPSKAAYYKQLLGAAVESAKLVLATADSVIYDGTTKTALNAEIANAETGRFTCPSAVNAEIEALKAIAAKMTTRIQNINSFSSAVTDASAAIEGLVGTKYENTEAYIATAALLGTYKEVSPSTLEDDVLNEVTPKLVAAKSLIANAKSCADILAYRLSKAAETAVKLGVTSSLVDDALNAVVDDDALVEALNQVIKVRLYEIIAENATSIPDSLKVNAMSETKTDPATSEYLVLANGIDFSCYVKNPHFYTFSTNSGSLSDNSTFPGWMISQESTGNLKFNGTAASVENPVTDVKANAYCGTYDLYQEFNNLPVGIYTAVLRTRTAVGKNGLDSISGVYDKHMWAIVGDGEKVMTAFEEGSSWDGYLTAIPNLAVDENVMLTVGATERLVTGGQDGNGKIWDTNTFVDDGRLYFVAPLAGYDYTGIATTEADFVVVAREYFSINGVRVAQPQQGINLVKEFLNNGTVRVKKVLVK